MSTIADVKKVMSQLSQDDYNKLMVELFATAFPKKSLEEYTEEHRFSNGRVCPHCGSVEVVRNGHRADGKQKYCCKDCKKVFVINTLTVTAGTHKDFDVWQKYVDCMMHGFSLRETATICGIHKNTAFLWRHKILDALQTMHHSIILEGIVEADETYFPISFKGNHKHNKVFTMPRFVHKRGKDHEYKLVNKNGKIVKEKILNEKGLSKQKVCVPCAVNRNGLSIAKVGKLGKSSYKCITAVLDKRIKEYSKLCTDKDKTYSLFSKKQKLELHQMKVAYSKKGIYNIQHINNYHMRLKGFLDKFYGVSTKYLNNYLVWNNFVVYAKETFAEKSKILLEFIVTAASKERCRDVIQRPILPVLVQD